MTGVLALAKRSDFDSVNDGSSASNMSKAQDLKNAGQTLNLVNDICLGGAVVAAGVTAALYFARPTVETTGSAALASRAAKARLLVVPDVARSGAGLNLLGRF